MIEYKYEKEIGVDPNEYFWHSMPNDKRQQMWDKEQEEYGFDSRQTWNLDVCFVAWIYPRLRMFKEKKDSYPSELTSEKWNEILDQMIEGFAYYLKDKYEYTNHEKIDNALELFAKWFHHLWW